MRAATRAGAIVHSQPSSRRPRSSCAAARIRCRRRAATAGCKLMEIKRLREKGHRITHPERRAVLEAGRPQAITFIPFTPGDHQVKPSRSCAAALLVVLLFTLPVAAQDARGHERTDSRQQRRPLLRRQGRRAVLLARRHGLAALREYSQAQAEAYLTNRGKKGFTVDAGGARVGPSERVTEQKTPHGEQRIGNAPG